MQKKILVVDDDIIILEMLSDILGKYEYSTTLVDNGIKAIEIIKRMFFDIVLLDIEMPGLNGIEVFRKIKEISPLTTVIMMTGADVDELVEKALNEGAFGIVYKPFNLVLLFKLIQESIQREKVIFISSKEKLESIFSQAKEISIKNYNLISTENILTAINLAKKTEFSIVIIYTDILDEKIISSISELKEINPKITIFLLVDHTFEDYMNLVVQKGVYLIVKKPFDVDFIFEKIEEIIAERKKESCDTILLVEDDDGIIQSLTFILEKEGYKVTSVKTGYDAVNKVKSQLFDVAVVDYKLPDISGIEVIKKLKQIKPNISGILITGYPDLTIAIEALREQVSDFIVKPINPEELLISIRKITIKKFVENKS